VLREGQKTQDGRRRRCLAHAGRRPCRRSGQSRVKEEKRRGRPLFVSDGVVVGGVGCNEVDGAEGAGSFNELYQLVVTSPQPLGAEGTRQSGAESKRGVRWVKVQDWGWAGEEEADDDEGEGGGSPLTVNGFGLGAIPDEEQASLEAYMTQVQDMITKYDRLAKCWPFLIAERLLKIQMGRLRHIKTALTEKLDNHPLSSANCASFNSNIPTGIPSALTLRHSRLPCPRRLPRPRYHVKASPTANLFLGLTVDYDTGNRTLTMSMSSYIPALLHLHRPQGIRLASSPSIYIPPKFDSSAPQMSPEDFSQPASTAQKLELQATGGHRVPHVLCPHPRPYPSPCCHVPCC
jgi:hypothetical protein